MSPVPTIPCPACGGALLSHQLDGLRIGICNDCGGAWFGSGQLSAVVKHGQAALDELLELAPSGAHTVHAGGSAKCPACNLNLTPTAYSGNAGVHLSACYQCGGVFIDAESIKALDDASHHTGAFPQQGSFGSVGKMTPAEAKVHTISKGFFRRRDPQYQYDNRADRVFNTLVAADIAVNILDIFATLFSDTD